MTLALRAHRSAGRLEVRVTGGIVRGVREGRMTAWRGIPYAAPPVGPLRFRAPRPVVGWRGVRDASQYGSVATQAYRGQFKGVGQLVPSGEDCLTVNVVSAALAEPSRRGRPVMVFIHGGGYSAGSSRDFHGQGVGFVRDGGIVYVSFNYRLGALGYLDLTRYSTRLRPIDSNLGLRDQVAALRWVRENIGRFGGDPRNVTLFGESAGGNAVTTLMATPAAKGLFARAIAQSAPTNAVYSKELAAVWAAEFVEILRKGLGTDEPGPAPLDVALMLSVKPATELVAAGLVLAARTPDAYPGTFCLAPVVDGDFLPERPLEAFRGGRAHRVPLIIGTNDREGSIFRGRIDILPRSPSRIRAVFRGVPLATQTAMATAYPGLPGGRAALDFAGDYAFWYPSVKVADFHSRFAPVHVYRFDVAPRLLRLVGLDATHGLELYALFDQGDARLARAMTALGGREPFKQAGRRMRGRWLRFAAGEPMHDDWPPYVERDRLTIVIGDVDHIVADPRAERRRAWNDFLPLG